MCFFRSSFLGEDPRDAGNWSPGSSEDEGQLEEGNAFKKRLRPCVVMNYDETEEVGNAEEDSDSEGEGVKFPNFANVSNVIGTSE